MADSGLLPHSSTLLAAIIGSASFFFYFHHGEHHMHGPLYIQLFVAANMASAAALMHFHGANVSDAFLTVSPVAGSWLLGVLGSCFVWRAFFNPLNKIPGPWMARITSFHTSYRLGNKVSYELLTEYHAKYGPYVRIRPNDLSITDPKAVPLAYGPNTTVTKGDWYDTGAPYHSMHTARDKAAHDQRRRYWAPAFSDKALRDYESILQEFNHKLIGKLDEFHGAPVNVSKWFNLFSFDVMAVSPSARTTTCSAQVSGIGL